MVNLQSLPLMRQNFKSSSRFVLPAGAAAPSRNFPEGPDGNGWKNADIWGFVSCNSTLIEQQHFRRVLKVQKPEVLNKVVKINSEFHRLKKKKG